MRCCPMERIMRGRANQEELALIKAAAWAWYQHGAGGEGKIPVREFDVKKTHREPKPSRYRLEVMRREERAEVDRCDSESITSDSNGLVLLSPTKTDMSLFDAYEIKRVSTQLDRILESSRRFSCDRDLPESPPQRPEINGRSRKKTSGLFWFRHAIAVCGSKVEVVNPVALNGRHRGKYVEVARLQSCRPRAHAVIDES